MGESILVTGATAQDLPVSSANLAAFAVAFLGSAALWWIYFDKTAEAGKAHISALDDPSRFARTAYDYHHVIMVAGVIVTAVGDELTITHPTHHASWTTAAVVLGGPALYLLGNGLFRRSMTRRTPWPHAAGIAVLAALCGLVPFANALMLAIAATLVIAAVAVADTAVKRT